MAGSWASWQKANGVIVAGEGKVPVCMAVATDNVTPVAFTVADFMGECNDTGEPGASREVTEINSYRYDSVAKIAGKSTPNDLTIQINTNKSDLDLIRGYYDNNTKIAFGIFDNTSGTPALIYGCIGTVSSWSGTVPLGSTGNISVTIAIINDAVNHTYTV